MRSALIILQLIVLNELHSFDSLDNQEDQRGQRLIHAGLANTVRLAVLA